MKRNIHLNLSFFLLNLVFMTFEAASIQSKISRGHVLLLPLNTNFFFVRKIPPIQEWSEVNFQCVMKKMTKKEVDRCIDICQTILPNVI